MKNATKVRPPENKVSRIIRGQYTLLVMTHSRVTSCYFTEVSKGGLNHWSEENDTVYKYLRRLMCRPNFDSMVLLCQEKTFQGFQKDIIS